MPLDISTTPAGAAPKLVAQMAKSFAAAFVPALPNDIFAQREAARVLMLDALITQFPEYSEILRILRAIERESSDEELACLYDDLALVASGAAQEARDRVTEFGA